MVVGIKNYNSIDRLATVRYGGCSNAEQIHEVMYLDDGRLSFTSDGSSFDLGSDYKKFIDAFHDGDIVTINRSGTVHQLFDFEEHNATVFITGKCNSNCIMCPCSDYERMTNNGMSDQWVRNYIDMLPPDVPHVVVTGGEPTLKTNQFFMVMDLLASKLPQAETLLLTNGRSFASKVLLHRLLDRCPPYLMMGIPIHGPNADIHDAITQTPNSFRQTCAGIDNLLANNVAIELRIVVSKLNHEYISDIADLIICRFPQVNMVNIMGLETMGNCAKNFKQVYIDYHAAWRDIQPAVVKLMENGIFTQIYNFPLCAVDQGYWPICKKSITPYKVRFADSCKECEARILCGGFFFSTLAVARPKAVPVHF